MLLQSQKEPTEDISETSVDSESIKLAYYNILGGACLALGIRYDISLQDNNTNSLQIRWNAASTYIRYLIEVHRVFPTDYY